ncbi:hypothetical protein F8M41_016008 [Gigaspora margarita]|uniref:MD-2-related lipid-recognition domain-containing protein n=1 Tax=Gigaspora margarita TaxID=4874 RepID=A0A8H4AQ26_GIGMA|nr:hypothetical protein F8M41_016008 [Gigaspora margarita]
MKNFIFAFILLALLLTVNAAPFQYNKKAITFQPCPYPGDFLNVKIGTNPPESEKSESFNVSGKLTKNDIIKNQTILEILYNTPDGTILGNDYVQTFNDSIKAGTQFTISALDVPTPKLPDIYLIGVNVGEKTNDPQNSLIYYACAYAFVSDF